MDTAFIIGNGESRNIYPIEKLKGNGIIYGCNAIYRDHPMLCDHIVAVNPPMYDELAKWHNNGKESPQIYGIDDISKWNYILPGDQDDDVPEGLSVTTYVQRIGEGASTPMTEALVGRRVDGRTPRTEVVIKLARLPHRGQPGALGALRL